MTPHLPGSPGRRDLTAPGPDAHATGAGCVVLCGGLGTRLAAAVPDLPKCVAEVAGRPFVEWVLLALRRQGVTDVLLATGHRGDQVEARLRDGGHLGMRLRYSREPEPLGTAGALRLALRHLGGDEVLAVNGDTYCDIDLRALVATHRANRARATILACPVDERSRYGAVDLVGGGRVAAFGEKQASGPGLVSCGVYLLEREVIAQVAEGVRADLESDVLPRLGGRLFAYVSKEPFIDIGTPESYAQAASVIADRATTARGTTRDAALGHVEHHLAATAAVMHRAADRCSVAIVDAAEVVAAAFTSGNKMLLCGNGGSAADCQHVAAEFVSRLDRRFDRAALPAIALTTDSSFLTAYANDVDFEGVFERQVEALGRPGDVLMAISTSGASVNVRRAIESARRRGMSVVGLFGEGAPLAHVVDVAIVVPSRSTAATQECMLAAEHSVCEVVEQLMYGAGEADFGSEQVAS